MEPIFNEAMLERIDADLVLANNGDRGARQRVYQKHMKWLLHYARYTNDQIALANAEYDAILAEGPEPGVGFAEEVSDETANETSEGTVENVTDESEDVTDESNETPETAEAEEGSSDETPEAESNEETVVENDPSKDGFDPNAAVVIVGDGAEVVNDSE
jgi:hypothetical protein